MSERDSLPELSFDGPSKDTRAAIREAIAGDLEPVVPRSIGTRVLHGVAAAGLVGALTIASYGPKALLSSAEKPATLAFGVVLTFVAVLLASSSFVPQLKNWGRDSRKLMVAGAIALWSLYLLSTVKEPAWGSALGGMAFGCGIRSLGAGVLAGGAFMWVWRKTDPWNPGLSGALIGTSAGVIASVCVGIVCAGGHGGHVLTGHWLAVPVLAAAGYLVSRRVLAP